MFSLELSITCAFFFATIWFKSSTTNKWYKYELPAPQFKTQTCHQCSIPELFSIFQNHISFNFRLILVYIYIQSYSPDLPVGTIAIAMLERLSSQDLLPWILGSLDARHVWRVARGCAELRRTATRPQSLLTLAESCKVQGDELEPLYKHSMTMYHYEYS